MREIRQGQFYRHFKGRLYQIMAVAEHTETREQMVVYQALYGDYRVYVRPYEMFASEVDHEKYPEADQKYRFELVKFEKKDEGIQEEKTETIHRKEEDPSPQEDAEKEEEAADSADGQINPILLEFLDAETLEEKMHILAFYRNKMDENLLNSIAISLDLVVEKKKIQEKYDEIMNCLSMMERFECYRLR